MIDGKLIENDKKVIQQDLSTSKLDFDKIALYIDVPNYRTLISMNDNIDINTIREWKDKLDWSVLSSNFQFDKKQLKEFISYIDWKKAIYCQEVCDDKFIKDNKLEKYKKELIYQSDSMMYRYNSEYSSINNNLFITVDNLDEDLSILIRRFLFLNKYSNNVEILFENREVISINIDSESIKRINRLIKIDLIINEYKNPQEKFDVIYNFFKKLEIEKE